MKTKNGLLAIFLLLNVATALNAQNVRFGITGGVNINKANFQNSKSTIGYQVGGKVEVNLSPLSNGLYTDIGLLLSSKSFKNMEYFLPDATGDLRMKGDLHYLTLPVQIGYKVKCNDKISTFISAGPYIGSGLWGKGELTLDGQKIDSSYKLFSDHLFKTFDWGMGAKIGLEYKKKYQLSIGYDLGLKDIQGENSFHSYKNRSLNISISYLLN